MRQLFEVVEQFVAPKRPGGLSEDMVADLGRFVVLLDGVTGKDDVRYRGLPGGRFAAEVVMATLAALDPDVCAADAVVACTSGLRDAIVAERGGMPAHPPGTQWCVYSPARREVWRVGDVHVRIGDAVMVTPAPPTDTVATEFRAALVEALLAEGRTVEELIADDPSWAAMLPLLSRQDVFANRADGHRFAYGVVNGTPVPSRFVEVFDVDASEVVIASDGYLSAVGSFTDAEAELAAVLASDPLLIDRYRGFRPAPAGGSFDDRAWVRFRVR